MSDDKIDLGLSPKTDEEEFMLGMLEADLEKMADARDVVQKVWKDMANNHRVIPPPRKGLRLPMWCWVFFPSWWKGLFVRGITFLDFVLFLAVATFFTVAVAFGARLL